MDIAALLKKRREDAEVSLIELAEKTSLPIDLLEYIENVDGADKKIIKLLADALEITADQFIGKEPILPPVPTEEEKFAAATAGAKFPSIRTFILDPVRCKNVEESRELFAGKEFSLAEKNLILYLSTTALYHFCSTNTSSFGIDQYLFKLHGKLLQKFKSEIEKSDLTTEVIEERLLNARSNVFGCDSMENIAIYVLSPFAEELENKLENNIFDFYEDIEAPFVWSYDEELSQIQIMDLDGTSKNTINLLDVKKKVAGVKKG